MRADETPQSEVWIPLWVQALVMFVVFVLGFEVFSDISWLEMEHQGPGRPAALAAAVLSPIIVLGMLGFRVQLGSRRQLGAYLVGWFLLTVMAMGFGVPVVEGSDDEVFLFEKKWYLLGERTDDEFVGSGDHVVEDTSGRTIVNEENDAAERFFPVMAIIYLGLFLGIQSILLLWGLGIRERWVVASILWLAALTILILVLLPIMMGSDAYQADVTDTSVGWRDDTVALIPGVSIGWVVLIVAMVSSAAVWAAMSWDQTRFISRGEAE